MLDLARKSLDGAQKAYLLLLQHQDAIKQKKNLNDVDLTTNPVILIVQDAETNINMFKVLLADYKSNFKGDDKPPAADAEAEKKLALVNAAFADCALRLNLDVKNSLPEYFIMKNINKGHPQTADEIINKTRVILGLKPDANPPADACVKFEAALKDAKQFFGLE